MDHPTTVFDAQVAAERLGSMSVLKMLAATFLDNVSQFLDDVRSAAEAGDTKTLERTVHMLASSVSYLEAPAASDAALAIELMCQEGKLDESRAALPALEDEVARLRLALTNLLSEGEAPRES